MDTDWQPGQDPPAKVRQYGGVKTTTICLYIYQPEPSQGADGHCARPVRALQEERDHVLQGTPAKRRGRHLVTC